MSSYYSHESDHQYQSSSATCVACRNSIDEIQECEIFQLETCGHLMCSDCFHHPLTLINSWGCPACGVVPSSRVQLGRRSTNNKNKRTLSSPASPNRTNQTCTTSTDYSEAPCDNFVLDFFSFSSSITQKAATTSSGHGMQYVREESEEPEQHHLLRASVPPPAQDDETQGGMTWMDFVNDNNDTSEQRSTSPEEYKFITKEEPTENPSVPIDAPPSVVNVPSSAAITATPSSSLISPFEVRNPDRQGKLLVEWRVQDPQILQQLVSVQSLLVSQSGGTLEVLPSCAGGNLHITMIEFTIPKDHPILSSDDTVSSIMKKINDSWTLAMEEETAVAAKRVQVGGLGHFNKRVIYSPIVGPGREVLGRAQAKIIEVLSSLDLIQNTEGNKDLNRPFTPHITLCKLKQGTNRIPRSIEKMLHNSQVIPSSTTTSTSSATTCMATHDNPTTIYRVGFLGEEDVGSIVLCCKRLKQEATPPVLMELQV